MPRQEEPGSDHYAHLNREERMNPYQVMDDLFDFAHLPDVQEMLWTWLKVTTCGSFHRSLNRAEREAILLLYEKLEKLVEAAHLLHKRNSPSEKQIFIPGKQSKKQQQKTE